jgi:hypothetical protein
MSRMRPVSRPKACPPDYPTASSCSEEENQWISGLVKQSSRTAVDVGCFGTGSLTFGVRAGRFGRCGRLSSGGELDCCTLGTPGGPMPVRMMLVALTT